MACRWCVHWVTEEAHIYAKETGQEGECRRYPKPEQTTSEYRCGEFVSVPPYLPDEDGSNLMHQFFMRMHRAIRQREEEREKRIAAEKKLKELRKKIRKPSVS